MKVHINTQVKNEALLLEQVLPIWKKYPVDKFIFYNDNSSDKTEEVIQDILGSRSIIMGTTSVPSDEPYLSKNYNEAHMRSAMMKCSQEAQADVAIALDADELISQSILDSYDEIIKSSTEDYLLFYWYNVVGSLNKIRQDPAYLHNYRPFIIPLKHALDFDLTQSQQHKNAMHETPRTPLTTLAVKGVPPTYGFIHLQAINIKFYALKQLAYKVFEHKEYGRPAKDLLFYDVVVNDLNFCEMDTPPNIIGEWEFDVSVFDKILEERNYIDYIQKYGTEELITFGKEYLS